MENKISCAVIKDLLPSYLDELTSEESNQMIEAHINECDECRTTLENMRAPEIDEEQIEIEKKEIDFLKKNRKHLETILGVTIGLAISIAIAGLIFALCKYAIIKRKEAIPTNDNEIVLYQDRSDYEPADMKKLDGYYYQTSESNFISDGEFKIDGSYYFCLTTREAPYIYSSHSLTRDIGNDTFEIMTYLYNRYNQQDELLKFTVQSIGNHQIAVYILESETSYFEEGEIIIFTESEYYDVE